MFSESLYFGQYNSTAIFKAMMNDIFADIQKVVIVYIDNILVFTKTNDEKKHNCTILEVL